MEKLVIVGAPGTIDARLAASTLFDLLGDPSLWNERYEILLRTHDGEGLADWAEPIQDGIQVILDFSTLDSSWTVLGPTHEGLVLEAMHVGAKYLALDDGLVELVVEDEAPVDVVPDTTEKEETEVTAEVVEPTTETTPETPAAPVKRGRGRPRKNPLPEGGTPAKAAPKLAAAKDLEPTQLPVTDNGQVHEQLRNLINSLIADADTDKLWKVIDSLRKL